MLDNLVHFEVKSNYHDPNFSAGTFVSIGPP